MSDDMMAETMVEGFTRLAQGAYISGYNSRLGSRMGFITGTFQAQ